MVCLKRALQIAHAAQHQLAVAMRQLDTLPAALAVEIFNLCEPQPVASCSRANPCKSERVHICPCM